MSTYLALWINPDGSKDWGEPRTANTAARNTVPRDAQASLIVTPIAMTPAEYREAMPILEPPETPPASWMTVRGFMPDGMPFRDTLQLAVPQPGEDLRLPGRGIAQVVAVQDNTVFLGRSRWL